VKQGKTKCQWCLHEGSNTDLKCAKCAGPIAVMEPWVLQCGWCSNSNRRDLTKNCTSCGGKLPQIPGTSRLPRPPLAPRLLPKGYENKIRYWKNVYFLMGAIFMLFLFTIILPIVGYFLLKYGKKKANNQIFALKYGTPTKGEIVNCYVDDTQEINGVNPVRIDYVFSTPNEECHSYIHSWDRVNLKRPKGEHLWVLFNLEDLSQNSIWPPMG